MNIQCSHSIPSKEPETVKKWFSMTVWSSSVHTTGPGECNSVAKVTDLGVSGSGQTQVRGETLNTVRFVLSCHTRARTHTTPGFMPVVDLLPALSGAGLRGPGIARLLPLVAAADRHTG